MFDDGNWGKPKVVMYCQIGRSLDMAQFAIKRAIDNTGMPKEDFDIVFVCWKTSDEVYAWLKENNYKYVDMEYDEGKGFLWNLYKGWNFGYEVGFQFADYVCPIATDHSFYPGWLANMMKHAQPNRIVNCKLIEPGTLPTLHTARNFGVTLDGEFREQEFLDFAKNIHDSNKDVLAMDEGAYGHRFDAMPFVCPKDVWERFGPMSKVIVNGSPDPERIFVNSVTGDTHFFNVCKANGVQVVKALDAISYHCGGLETRRGQNDGRYT
jgi:hypothetical protein